MPTYDEVIGRIIPDVEHHQNRYARGLEQLVEPGCRWLDIGAGARTHHGWTGLDPQVLAKRAGMTVGCDLVESHLKRNQSLQAAAVADARRLPFSDRSFDLVTANMVVEHLEDPPAVFSEVARVLAHGGRFAFVTPNRANPMVFVASILLSRRVRKTLARLVESRDPEHIFHTFYRANSGSTIRSASSAAGFMVREIDYFNSYPMARRPWVLTALESFWIRTIRSGALRRITSNVYAVLEKKNSTEGDKVK
jgi:ubiquinone/menaquinone biosynthesis C-methylase UbiE